ESACDPDIAASLLLTAHPYRHLIVTHDDIGIQHRQQPLEIAAARGCEKGFNDRPLPVEIRFGRLALAAHAPPRAARKLPRRLGGTFDDGRDILEWNIKHVVQYESDALGGVELIEHDEQREPDRIGEQRV